MENATLIAVLYFAGLLAARRDQRFQVRRIDFDLGAKIGTHLLDRIRQIAKGVIQIFRAIADNDHLQPAAHQLIEAEILEMSAVRQLNIVAVFVQVAPQKELADSRRNGIFMPTQR